MRRYTFLVEWEIDTDRIGSQVAALATGAYPWREKRDITSDLRPSRAILVKEEEIPSKDSAVAMESAAMPERARER